MSLPVFFIGTFIILCVGLVCFVKGIISDKKSAKYFPATKHNYGTLVAAKRLRAAVLKLTDELAEMELSEAVEIECAQALEVIEETEWLDDQPWPNMGS